MNSKNEELKQLATGKLFEYFKRISYLDVINVTM